MNVFELVSAFNLLLSIATFALLIRSMRLLVTKEELVANLQDAINDTAEGMGEIFTSTFRDPDVKRAMTILGKESGVARADSATIDKFNENVGALNPALSMIAEQLDMDPTQVLSLASHPAIAPLLEGFLGTGVASSPSSSKNIPQA